MTYRVKIHDIDQVFERAHNCVVREIYHNYPRYRDRDTSTANLIKTVWHELYGVSVVYENSRAQWLDFDDERHYNVFLLKV